jgi:signal peptidase I
MSRSTRWSRGVAAGSIGIVAVAAALVRGRLRRYAIAEKSMVPSLDAGDFVLAIRSRRVPERGDVVVYPSPIAEGMDLVKRVIGLPGETLTIANGQVHVDGAVLAEPWADGPTMPDGRWLIGDDQVFPLGDARAISIHDGRRTGPVDVSEIPWRVVLRYWPLSAAGRL